MSTAPFHPHVVPSIIPNKVSPRGWICQRTTFYFYYFLPLYLHLIWLLVFLIQPWTHLQHTPWLMAVPSVGYLCVSIPWTLRKISQTGHLVGISWRNLQACALCCSVWFTCCCFQIGPSKRNNVYICAQISQCTTYYRFFHLYFTMIVLE